MEENNKSNEKHISSRGDELVLPILALLFALYYFYTIKDLAWEAQINGVLIGTVLIGLVLIFLVRTGLEVFRGQASLKFSDTFCWGRFQAKRLSLFGLAVAYVLVIPYSGYTLTTFLFLIAAMFLLGVRSPLKLLIIPLILSSTGYYLFIALLDTRFPPGPVEKLLGALF